MGRQSPIVGGVASVAWAFPPVVFSPMSMGLDRDHSGLGLGLALVKHLVDLHGGRVFAHSEGEGKGATFVVELPLRVADESTPPVAHRRLAAAGLGAASALPRLDGVRVLVVDDDADALELASAILTGAGGTVTACPTAAEALQLLRQWRPDVLVSDIQMPGEDGYSLIRKVRALDRRDGGETPAVALSAYGRAEDRMRALGEGYSMHVPKPVDPIELTTIIASLSPSGSQAEPE